MSVAVTKLEQRSQQLAALNKAAVAIAGELSLDRVLQLIVDSARELIAAQYAALGVPNAEGLLEAFIYSGLSAEDAAHIPHLPRGYGLLGAIIREQRPIRLGHISDDPRSVGFPPGHPPMDSFLGIPILAGDQPVGNLYFTNKQGAAEFTVEDEQLVILFASHAAVAIQNARLYEQVGRLAVLEERTRIGMDLHDGIIQSIYAVGLTLESTRLVLAEDLQEADQLLEVAIAGLNDAIRDIRNFILDLRPQRFAGDLSEALARLQREFQANTAVPVILNATPEAVQGLPTAVSRALFLTSQEALANIARHARATQVQLTIERLEAAVRLTIADNGRGFDAATQAQATGHGLANMRTRAEELRGSFNIESFPGAGTTVELILPVR